MVAGPAPSDIGRQRAPGVMRSGRRCRLGQGKSIGLATGGRLPARRVTVGARWSTPSNWTESTSETGAAPSLELQCSESIATLVHPSSGNTVVLGVVALPTSDAMAFALQTDLSGERDPTARLFAKSGLEINASRPGEPNRRRLGSEGGRLSDKPIISGFGRLWTTAYPLARCLTTLRRRRLRRVRRRLYQQPAPR